MSDNLENNQTMFADDLGNRSLRVKIIGVGGAGVNAVDRLQLENHDCIQLAGVNTDAQALAESPLVEKVMIGRGVTRGMSAGGEAELGRQAAEADRAALARMCDGVDLVFLLAGLGGGTASGAAPVIAAEAASAGALVIAFVTLPFTMEGARRHQQAEEALVELRGCCDAVIPLPNDILLQQLEESATVLDAFAQADAWVSRGVRSICAMLLQTGLINLDFAALRKAFPQRGGKTLFGLGRGQGDDFLKEALNDLMLCPLLHTPEYARRADVLLVNIIGGTDLSISQVNQILATVTEKFGSKAHTVLGAVIDDRLKQHLEICVIGSTDLNDGRFVPRANPVRNRAAAIPAAATRNTREDTHTPPAQAKPVPEAKTAYASRLSKKTREENQEEFDFVSSEAQRGCFDSSDRNLYDGEDLDVPTYLRRGIRITL